MAIALSKNSVPVISWCFPGFVLALFNSFAKVVQSTSVTNELFPEPLHPARVHRLEEYPFLGFQF